jgi:hypothetical protein
VLRRASCPSVWCEPVLTRRADAPFRAVLRRLPEGAADRYESGDGRTLCESDILPSGL